jgi:glycosyltransferase involved in cell wall biosynthesis
MPPQKCRRSPAMSDSEADKLHWSVDSLVLRGRTCFGFGWIFHEEREIIELRLLVQRGVPEEVGIAATMARPRHDVASHFNSSPRSLHCGFVLFGAGGARPARAAVIRFRGVFADGEIFELVVPQAKITHLDGDVSHLRRARLRQLWNFAFRAARLCLTGKFAQVMEKTGDYRRRASLSTASAVEQVRERMGGGERQVVVLIVDHDLGGGANQYREQLVARKIAQGATVFVLSYHLASLSLQLAIRSAGVDHKLLIAGYEFVRELAASIGFSEIIYNTGVSFVDPQEIPQLLIDVRAASSARLTVLVHDFFVVCPSHFLLNHQGSFCAIPEPQVCRSCLAQNQQGFATLYQGGDIVDWRERWGAMLGCADEIVVFSNSTLKLLRQAYPALAFSQAAVRPHSVEHMAGGAIEPRCTDTLKIGVVGHIGHHKGAGFVRELAAEIRSRQLDIQLVVIGSIEVQCDSTVVSQTGPFPRDELPALIEKSDVNVMLFPSICPETFSYVVQELIELELPIACFNLGAPAERLAKYANGLVLTSTNPSHALDELVLFHRKLYLN